jgi:hypothetical protein
LDRFNFMRLRMRYDDGFAAFLNGVPIASANPPGDLAWYSFAAAAHDDAAAVIPQEFRIDAALAALKPGRNVLAIHGLNLSLGSSDFLIGAELVAGERRVSSSTNAAMLYSGSITLTDLTTVRARAFDGLEWSALAEATFVVGSPSLAISELHYHPADPSPAEAAAGWTDADMFEFVELHNDGIGAFDLTGVRFTVGIRFDFTGAPIAQLAAGDYVLVVKNRAAFELRYGPGLPVAGEYAGQLDNAGERITLLDAQSQIIADFIYGTDAPWPVVADGDGPSLEVIDPDAGLASPQSWVASTIVGGSPGGANPAHLILEILRRESGGVLLRFNVPAGQGYTLHARDSLTAGTWQSTQTGAPQAAARVVDLSLDTPGDRPIRFFRVSIP